MGDTTMLTKSIIALAFAIVLGFGSAATALEGFDGDNNPVPGNSYRYVPQGQQP
jgi:hypothetical protein